ncbi:hypothetical protein SLA2020_431950 [Shorea laevis]
MDQLIAEPKGKLGEKNEFPEDDIETILMKDDGNEKVRMDSNKEFIAMIVDGQIIILDVDSYESIENIKALLDVELCLSLTH